MGQPRPSAWGHGWAWRSHRPKDLAWRIRRSPDSDDDDHDRAERRRRQDRHAESRRNETIRLGGRALHGCRPAVTAPTELARNPSKRPGNGPILWAKKDSNLQPTD